jgi:hypothetical protein
MKTLSVVLTRLAALLLVCNGAVSLAQDTQRPPTSTNQIAAAKAPWGRIVLVGASVSAGFTESEMLGGPNTAQYRLNRYVDAAVSAPHEPSRNLASTLFFIKPDLEGQRQITLALESKPTLVLGLDFLFWFCYGAGNTDAERLQQFERGLKLLEAVECPLILGDIPDASGASQDMLTPDLIPSAKAMAAANQRLREWAASRKQVVIVPLSKFMRSAMANQSISIHGRAFAEGKSRALLQDDRLHPTPTGCAVLALTMLDAFLSRQPALSSAEVRWDPAEVLQLALKTSGNGAQSSSSER